ncbi:MAG: MFS transporter, partial [Actinobacteria bacterium]|nr:MFS transporter [Actinomycetota bacterium]
EYAGASAFLVEYAPAHRRGLYAAVVPASTAAGLLLGSLLAALLTSVMSAEQLNEWGWRLPFLLAAPMGLIGRYIRTKLEDTPAFRELQRGFAHTLIPIALAYLVAHYFSLFVYQEQAQFTYLLSDPLGTSTTDLFGTAEYGIDFSALGSNLIWYVQVAALIVGHVLGLTLAHDRALVYWSDYRRASRSQYWMLAVMVAFTCFGLYLLSVGGA